MLTIRPDFYDEFRCLAGACRHSCCVGWEIDVDEETLALYDALDSPLGEELRAHIERGDTPHLRLTEDGRCPFLRRDGLCRLILGLGEDALCDICALHPRFFNEYPGRLEAGLGLCCEEAARLLTAGKGHLRLLAESDDGQEEAPGELLELRAQIFEILCLDSLPLSERMRRALAMLGQAPFPFRPAQAAAFLLTLKRMDGAWTALLEHLAAAPAQELEPRLSGMRYVRVAEYLVYRHFAAASNRAEAARRLQFCFFAARLVCALEPLNPDTLRLFSAEIEYSDENVEKLCAWLDNEFT